MSTRNLTRQGSVRNTLKKQLKKQGSLRNALKRQGSLRNAFKQGSFRDVFKQGSLRNIFQTGASDDGNFVEEHEHHIIKEYGNVVDISPVGDKMKKKKSKKLKSPKSPKSPKTPKTPNSKKKKKNKLNKKKKNKKSPKEDIVVNDMSESDYQWWSLDNSSALDDISFTPRAPRSPRRSRSPRSRKTPVHIDMSGDLDLTERTHTETGHSSQEWSLSSHMVRKMMRDESLRNTPPLKEDIEEEKSHPSAGEPTPVPSSPTKKKSTFVYPSTLSAVSDCEEADDVVSTMSGFVSDDVSILSDNDLSDDILDDLSCILDCDESEENSSKPEESKREAEGCDQQEMETTEEDEPYVDLNLLPMKRISDLTEMRCSDLTELRAYVTELKCAPMSPRISDLTELRSYADLRCSHTKRISDLTAATPRVSMASEMQDGLSCMGDNDDDDDESASISGEQVFKSPRHKGRRSEEFSAWGGKSLKRISELTEATLYELENCDDDDYPEASSICSDDSGDDFNPLNQPVNFYANSQQIDDSIKTTQDIFNPFKDNDTELKPVLRKSAMSRGSSRWDNSFSSNQPDTFSLVSFSTLRWEAQNRANAKQ